MVANAALVSRLRKCLLTRLSSVTSQELSLALVPELPGHACSHCPVEYVSMGSGALARVFVLQKYSVCHVDDGVGRLKGWLSHVGGSILGAKTCRDRGGLLSESTETKAVCLSLNFLVIRADGSPKFLADAALLSDSRFPTAALGSTNKCRTFHRTNDPS